MIGFKTRVLFNFKRKYHCYASFKFPTEKMVPNPKFSIRNLHVIIMDYLVLNVVFG